MTKTVGKTTLEESLTVGFGERDWLQSASPTLYDLVADDNGGITYEPPAGSENGDGSGIDAEMVEPVHPLPLWGGKGEVKWVEGGREGWRMHTTDKRAWWQVCSFYWTVTGNCRKHHSKYLMLVNWKLLYVVFGVYCILTPICPCFLLVYCVAACVWIICDCSFLEKVLNIFIYASPNSNKIKFDWHCVLGQGIRKKNHAKNLRDLYWNLWAV